MQNYKGNMKIAKEFLIFLAKNRDAARDVPNF